MPITPLHFGAALPFELALRDRFSSVAFVLANAVIDIPARAGARSSWRCESLGS